MANLSLAAVAAALAQKPGGVPYVTAKACFRHIAQRDRRSIPVPFVITGLVGVTRVTPTSWVTVTHKPQ